MTEKKASLVRIYAFSVIVSLILVTWATFQTGIEGLIIVLLLIVLEVSLSFDNAVINARILKKMTKAWQTAFLTVGILIAVFGVRIILPIILVAIAVGASFSQVVDLALNDPEQYGEVLKTAKPMIIAFGGNFLFMIFLNFFFEKRQHLWWKSFEEKMHKVGSKSYIVSTVIASALLIFVSQIVPEHEQRTVLTAGFAGIGIYLLIHGLDHLVRRSNFQSNVGTGVNASFKAGLIGFLYLEVIDASFSLDGVVGAFAITTNIILIGVGLGVGALFVRTITIHMLRRGVLTTYRYLEHGAHYAIGVLASIMFLSLYFEVPEVFTGTVGATIIIASVLASRKINKKEKLRVESRGSG